MNKRKVCAWDIHLKRDEKKKKRLMKPKRHKAILDYLSASGFTESFNTLKSETHNENFASDPKQKYSGLLEKKWTSVIRLQKKVELHVNIYIKKN